MIMLENTLLKEQAPGATYGLENKEWTAEVNNEAYSFSKQICRNSREKDFGE